MRGADAPPRGWSWPGAWLLPALVGAVLLLGAGCALASQQVGGMGHQVAGNPNATASVPFDGRAMSRTLQATAVGGVERVVAHDPGDQSQISGARAYLWEEAARFQRGQYEDPAKMHGMDMPGSQELAAGYGRVRVSYADLPDGGQVTYAATDAALVQALHAWFDRRLMGSS